MEKLIEHLESAQESLKDFNKFKHLFSDDDAEKELAKLRESVGKILFHVKASKIKKVVHPKDKPIRNSLWGDRNGLVQIRPCSSDCEGKTYVGFHIGDVALSSEIAIEDDALICRWAFHNPGIFVPELNKVIYGCESWWGPIKSIEELRQITDEDIENVWYVKLLKKQLEHSS